MSHIVAPICVPLAVGELRQKLQDAHDFLAEAAKAAAPRLLDVRIESWGTHAKRARIQLPKDRPDLARDAESLQSFIEVMNQCATLERLIDVLYWITSETSDLADFQVQVCHPTTSSLKPRNAEKENDLVLVANDGRRARFEISDVASPKDGNRKLQKELISLGIPMAEARLNQWPSARLFIGISEEFSQYVREKKPVAHRFLEVKAEGETRVFEVRPAEP